MKKLKMLICILFMVCFSTMAQENASPTSSLFGELKTGILAGPNFSNLYGDVSTSAVFRTGFHFGAVIQTTVSNSLILQVEPQFSREGHGQNNNSSSIRIDYFNVPILARVYALNDWSFEAGAKFAIRISELSEGPNSDGRKTNRIKTVWPGLVLGSSYSFTENWSAQFRANYTPSDIVKSTAGDSEGTSSLVFQFSAVYFFK